MPNFVISREDWSLHRKGHMDQQRHQEKVKEAIKKNLADIVSEESIILSDGNKVIKVPIRSLEQYRFRFNFNKQEHAGSGSGKSKKGDVLGSDSAAAPGKGKGAGEEPGVDYYEAEITLDELAEMIFEDLCLPNLQEKKNEQIESESLRFNDVRKKGLTGNIDKKRTIVENLKRNAIKGEPGIFRITPDDLRYKTWEVTIKHESSAVILAIMDTSGSMGTFEKYIARSFFFWMVRFLRTKYQRVQIIFIAHHTQAKEVTEEEFFTKGESGGTKCSSAYQLALDLIDQHYNPEDHNIYPFHFSDGDNLPSDNEACVELVNKLLSMCNLFGYGEIVNPYYRSSTLMTAYKRIKSPKFVSVTIKDKSEVYPALRAFFSPREPIEA
ncbi:MAG: sporulation protein YhbH [Bacillota bacterium]